MMKTFKEFINETSVYKTLVLKDKSIVNIYDNGSVELFPSPEWKMPKDDTKYFGKRPDIKCHSFKYSSKEEAEKIWNEINNTTINEQQTENRITIQDIYNTLKEVFADNDVLSTDSVYEHGDNGLRLIISINKLYSKNQINIFTKLLFNVDDAKTYLTTNSFKYLYEINCDFKEEQFNDINDFKNKLNEIITGNKFGRDLKILSEFIKKPEHVINDWFYKNKIKDISVTGFKFEPEIKNVPCKDLTFVFTMTINSRDKIKLTIRKSGVSKFKLTFNIFNKDFDVEKSNLTTLIQVIGETIRDNMKK